MPHSPPLPRSPRSPARNPASPSFAALPRPLNPDAAPFSPSRASEVAGVELLEWLLFSPSSSEGWSSMGCQSIISPAPSLADVIRGKGKAPMVEPTPPPLHLERLLRWAASWRTLTARMSVGVSLRRQRLASNSRSKKRMGGVWSPLTSRDVVWSLLPLRLRRNLTGLSRRIS
jgi:hypothetical protein